MSFSELFPTAQYGARPVIIMDGGMGTTLGAPPFSEGLDTTLWSSELLKSEEGREKLKWLNRTWVECGAEVIGSCTYQSSLPLFLCSLSPSSGPYTPTETSTALSTMLAALPIITHPYTTPPPSSTHTSRSPHPYSSLSLGPLGAILSPGQEYGGLYPEPYGIGSTSKFPYSDAAARAEVVSTKVESTNDSIEDALTSFHLTRLEQFALDATFDELSLIAFETIPNLSEALAIRRAMRIFNTSLLASSRSFKPFYISYVFPIDKDGNPRHSSVAHKDLKMEELMRVIVETTFGGEGGESYEKPSGIGINCTSPLKIKELVEMMGVSMRAASVAGKITKGEHWLVLYPDGGSVYDVVTRTWSSPDGMDPEQWATLLASNVGLALSARFSTGERGDESDEIWKGVMVGGCCKAGPGSIKALREECTKKGWLGI